MGKHSAKLFKRLLFGRGTGFHYGTGTFLCLSFLTTMEGYQAIFGANGTIEIADLKNKDDNI